MKFFLDNNISHRLAAALLVLENRVERGDWTVRHLKDRFEPQTEDVTWLEALGREGKWIVWNTKSTSPPTAEAATST